MSAGPFYLDTHTFHLDFLTGLVRWKYNVLIHPSYSVAKSLAEKLLSEIIITIIHELPVY